MQSYNTNTLNAHSNTNGWPAHTVEIKNKNHEKNKLKYKIIFIK